MPKTVANRETTLIMLFATSNYRNTAMSLAKLQQNVTFDPRRMSEMADNREMTMTILLAAFIYPYP